MPTQEELGAYAILLGGGLLIVGGMVVLARQPRQAFILTGQVCNNAAVRGWIQLKLDQGKITQEDAQRLLLTAITLDAWLNTVFSRRGFNISDVTELAGLC